MPGPDSQADLQQPAFQYCRRGQTLRRGPARVIQGSSLQFQACFSSCFKLLRLGWDHRVFVELELGRLTLGDYAPGREDASHMSHDRVKLISKTLPEKHTKHCVLENDSLNQLQQCVLQNDAV